MSTREDIADLLRAGATTAHIRRELHVSSDTVAATRRAFDLPAARAGRRRLHSSIEDAYQTHTEPVDGGHLRWTGPRNSSGVPIARHCDVPESVYRLGFRMRYGREPVGHAEPGCGMAGYVAGAHLEDRPMREKNRTVFAAVFGEVS
jgi:hypothetical protein